MDDTPERDPFITQIEKYGPWLIAGVAGTALVAFILRVVGWL